MPIRDIQQRMAEAGRIRLGQKVATKSGKSRPDKLDRFRFTSGNRGHIEALAKLYGGQAREWDNNGRQEFEVVTDAKSVPIIVVKGGISQWMESWSGGGCIHRCDGYRDVLTDNACDPNDPAHRDAKPTTRLSVMLSDLESLGVWRLETKGWNAAAELPSMAELAMFVGDYVPATLNLQERVSIRDGQTSRFVVPVLDLAVSKRRLVELVGGAGGTPAIGAAPAASPAAVEAPRPDYQQLVADATTVEELQALWRQAGEAGHLTDSVKAWITARAGDLKPHDPEQVEEPAHETAAAPGDDRDTVWMALVIEAGKHGVTDSELRQMLLEEYAQPVEDIDAGQLQAALEDLRAKAGAA
ncbi:MAG TPA: hypothetical protein VFJ94_03935 [Intrasporangium sp.]|uniref:recombination directionality factor n=1 Tax=Intrasporangium sp. TaxID=1925024 RepID=UPI002D77E555|nr:hypothetical protein [Intrasporangium sp.]HET7397653.1 hypothetical protein [Intrasporangium sp.]